MPLRVNLRHLEAKNVNVDGELTVEELRLNEEPDELIQPQGNVKYDLEVEQQNENLLVRGMLHLDLKCECSRCLKPFNYPLHLEPWETIVPLQGEEAAQRDGDLVDLTPFLREDIFLAFPQRPLCKEECAGLPGVGQNAKSKGDLSLENESSAQWAELNKLKF